jgi:TRAP-type uncharacterized transport system substrate-binding protein
MTMMVKTMHTSPSPIFRSCFTIAAGLALCCGLPFAASAETLAERTNRGLVEIITDGEPGSMAMTQDLASVLDDGATRRLLPVAGHGGLRALIDLEALRGIDIAIVSSDVLEQARKAKLPGTGIENGVTYIAKLHNEELHLLARGDIHSVEDLGGKRVDFGGAPVTGPMVLGLLDVKVKRSFDDPAIAFAKLKSGEVAAIAYLAAKPTSRFAVLTGASGLHFLSIPLKPELAAAYVPARLTAEDYPGLVRADAPVDTIAVGTVMLAAKLQPNTERYRNVANFVDAFFTQFPRLQEPAHDPKWAEVNLAAELPGWTRFPPADIWLKHNVVAAAPAVSDAELHEIFAKFLDERSRLSGGRAFSEQEKDQLFDRFRRWQETEIR